MRFAKLFPLFCFALATFSSYAAAAPKFYVALDAGVTRGKAAYFDEFTDMFPAERRSSTSEGGRIRLGYRASRFFAMEVGYVDLGDFAYRFDPDNCPPLFDAGCDFTTTSSVSGPLTNAIVMYPFNDRFRAKARLGWLGFRVKARNTGPDASGTDRGTDSEGGVFYGAGIEYSPTDRIDVELGWTYFDAVIFGVTLGTNDAFFEQGAVTLTSIGIAYRF